MGTTGPTHECAIDKGIDDLWLNEPNSSTGLWLLVLYGIIRSQCSKKIIELGCYRGESTRFLAKAAKLNGGHVWSLDHDEICLDITKEHLTAVGLLDYVTLVQSKSWESFGEADFVFVDSQHDEESLTKDWDAWAPKVTSGGIVAFHDMADGNGWMVDWYRKTFPAPGWQHMRFPGNRGLLVVMNDDDRRS